MANAKKCDRCGSFYTTNTYKNKSISTCPFKGIGFVDDKYYRYDANDMCDACLIKLELFLGGRDLV